MLLSFIPHPFAWRVRQIGMAAVLKTDGQLSLVGSSPTPAALERIKAKG